MFHYKKIKKTTISTILLLLIFSGCSISTVSDVGRGLNTATSTHSLPSNANDTQTTTPNISLTSTPIPTMENNATLSAEATSTAGISLCDEFGSDISRSFEISPNGKWFIVNCGYKINRVLIVQNQEGVRWVLNYEDYEEPEFVDGLGSFTPIFWSNDGRFLYFSKIIGYSGGGTQCFQSGGVYGLYRLHLKSGTVDTLVTSDDKGFPGEKIRFSSTGEYYAIDREGLLIYNLVNGKTIEIPVSGVIDFDWSPDGRFLAFSVARCGEYMVESSSMYIWDSTMNRTTTIYSTSNLLLRPDTWIDSHTLSFNGEEIVENNTEYTLFMYDLFENGLFFSGTLTPKP